MKRKIAFLLALLMAASILAGCGGNKTWTGKHEVEITVNNYGTIRLEVDADSAPKTASQFLNLAKKGFYNNLTIYRVIDGFAIYGGCPNKNGTGKASTTVEGEFTSNGFNNPLSMTRGAIGMARGTDKNSGTWAELDGYDAALTKALAALDGDEQQRAAAGLALLNEYDDKIKKLLTLVEEKGVKFQVGFNRRFDHNHKAVADAVKDGTIGDPHIVIVSSRDPEPPPASYVAVSGGIFYDMMIHDFDMVRYVTGSEAVEISAVGSCLVNPNLQEESGIPDVDTAVVTMKMANGCIAVINNSRQAVYGYDQRVEAFGSKGMASDANDLLNTTTVLTKDGAHSEKPLWFFLERYNQAFINQVISFVDAINNDKPVAVGAVDGLRPVLMAKAATESCRNGGVYVKVEE